MAGLSAQFGDQDEQGQELPERDADAVEPAPDGGAGAGRDAG